MTDHPTAPVQDDDELNAAAEEFHYNPDSPMTRSGIRGETSVDPEAAFKAGARWQASRLSPTPETDQQQQGASLRDRAGRPPDQAPAGLGDTATIPSAKPTDTDLVETLNHAIGLGKEWKPNHAWPDVTTVMLLRSEAEALRDRLRDGPRYPQPCFDHEYITPGCADCGRLA